MATGIAQRIEGLDWAELQGNLHERGFALTPAILSSAECRELAGLYQRQEGFRSHILMARYRFGRGEYKYFDYPLPPMVQAIRESVFPPLAAVANVWNERLRIRYRFPENHAAFLKICA